jgi:hypothetical protein
MITRPCHLKSEEPQKVTSGISHWRRPSAEDVAGSNLAVAQFRARVGVDPRYGACDTSTRMSWFYLVVGLLWVGVFLVTVTQWAFLPWYRRMIEATEQRPSVELALMLLLAVSFTGASFSPDRWRWVPFASMIPLLGYGVWSRRRRRGHSDLPPAFGRLDAVPLNPLVIIRRPVRTSRAVWEAFGHPLRSRRETRTWLERQESA